MINKKRKRSPGVSYSVFLLAGMAGLPGAPDVTASEMPQVPDLGRYQPLYPGFYATFSAGYDPRDKAFDQGGDERDSATPSAPGRSEFPVFTQELALQWVFPWFETYDIPFISERLFTARATLRSGLTETNGFFDDFSQTSDLNSSEDGFGDISLQFGGYLAGSQNWRDGYKGPFSSLLLFGIDIPTGEHDPDSPNNIGSNEFAYHATLGGQYRASSGWTIDGGLGYRIYDDNEEPAFGGAEPRLLGDVFSADLRVARGLGDFNFAAFVSYQDGAANEYEDIEFVTNPPTPALGMENFPRGGTFSDDGTQLLSVGASLRYFATQNLLLGLHAIFPLAGESGEFTVPFDQRPSICGTTTPPPPGCDPTPSGAAVRVDGLGKARSYASNIFMFTLSYSFERGDPWL